MGIQIRFTFWRLAKVAAGVIGLLILNACNALTIGIEPGASTEAPVASAVALADPCFIAQPLPNLPAPATAPQINSLYYGLVSGRPVLFIAAERYQTYFDPNGVSITNPSGGDGIFIDETFSEID